MKKVLVLLVLSLMIVGFTNAQVGKMKLGVGAYVGLPMGTFGDVTSVGFGGVAQGEYMFADKIVGTVTTGYLSFSGKTVNTVDLGTWSIIPILVGGKYFFTPNLYGAVQIGLNMISTKVPTYVIGGFTFGGGTASSSEFGFNIGAGYDMGNLDFLVKYGTFGSDASAVSLTALYKFSLN